MHNASQTSRLSTVTLWWCDDTLTRMGTDPTLSDWLRQALRDLGRHDPLDALYDCERLTALMRDRADQTLRKAGARIGPNADSPNPVGPNADSPGPLSPLTRKETP